MTLRRLLKHAALGFGVLVVTLFVMAALSSGVIIEPPTDTTLHQPTIGPSYPTPDGELDCLETDETWFEAGSSTADEQGFPTREQALEHALERWDQQFDGEDVTHGNEGTRGSFIIAGREVVTVVVKPAPAGGWTWNTINFCGEVRLND